MLLPASLIFLVLESLIPLPPAVYWVCAVGRSPASATTLCSTALLERMWKSFAFFMPP